MVAMVHALVSIAVGEKMQNMFSREKLAKHSRERQFGGILDRYRNTRKSNL